MALLVAHQAGGTFMRMWSLFLGFFFFLFGGGSFFFIWGVFSFIFLFFFFFFFFCVKYEYVLRRCKKPFLLPYKILFKMAFDQGQNG